MAPEARADAFGGAEPDVEGMWTITEGKTDSFSGGSADAITYPTDASTVSSPVTFTGTASNGVAVELWDTDIVPVLTHLASASNVGTAASGTQSTTVSCAAGTLLIICCQAQATTAVQSGIASCTVGGANARLVRGQNVETYSRTEIWAYWAATALSSSTVTFTLTSATACDTAIIVTGADGTDQAGIGIVGGTTFAGTGSPTVNLIPSSDDSTLFAVTHSQTTPMSPGTNMSELHEIAWSGDSFQTQEFTGTVTWNTSVALASSSGASAACSLQVLEVRPGQSKGYNLINPVASRGVGSNSSPDWWYFTGTSATYTPNYTTAPDGSNEASRIQIAATATTLELGPRLTSGGGRLHMVLPSTQYTMSWWVKDLGSTGTNTARLRYTFFVGSTGGSEAYSGDNSGQITAAAGGWTRLQYAFTTAADTTAVSLSFLGGYNTTYTVDWATWGAKLELGATATGTYL